MGWKEENNNYNYTGRKVEGVKKGFNLNNNVYKELTVEEIEQLLIYTFSEYPFLEGIKDEIINYLESKYVTKGCFNYFLMQFLSNYDELIRVSVFVYGTLLPGNPQFSLFGDNVEEVISDCLIGGKLYTCGRFPAVKRDKGRDKFVVEGTLINLRGKISELLNIFRILNNYEGYSAFNPKNSLYILKKVQVSHFENNSIVLREAYFYEYNGEKEEKDYIGTSWIKYYNSLSNK